MASYWMDGETLTLGEIGWLIEVCPQGRKDYYTLSDSPGRTNQSHEPRAHGWLGTTDNTARHGCGIAKVVRVCANGRARVETVDKATAAKYAEDNGYPGVF